jgi:hypothetical protein
MEYVTYDQYNAIGGVLDVAAFERYSVRAFSKITTETHSRILSMANVPNEVKHLCRDLIEYLFYNAKQEKAVASTSQSQGGASESESYVDKTSKDIENDINSLIYDYLASVADDNGIPLLYRGC